MQVIRVPSDALSSHVIMWPWGSGAGLSGSMQVWVHIHTCSSCGRLPKNVPQLDCCFYFFVVLWFNLSTRIIDAVKRSVNRASRSSYSDKYQLHILHLSPLCFSLSLFFFFFLFAWKLLAARLTTRAVVMTLDTRVDSALALWLLLLLSH